MLDAIFDCRRAMRETRDIPVPSTHGPNRSSRSPTITLRAARLDLGITLAVRAHARGKSAGPGLCHTR